MTGNAATSLSCYRCGDEEGPFARTGNRVLCERCINTAHTSGPLPTTSQRESVPARHNGPAEVGPTGKGKAGSPTSMYELGVCDCCGQPTVRIRVCSCNHEAVYHDPPGVGPCKVGAGLRDCGCARFSEGSAR